MIKITKLIKKYGIRVTDNSGNRKMLGMSFKNKTEARKHIEKILSKPKKGQTSYRNSQSGTGLNNPRIKKYLGFK